jgi:DNA mismatch endonuclease (patch repair protein)
VIDTLSPVERSARMARIKSGNTLPELNLRKAVHRLGLRFRLHGSNLPGKPDLVFPQYKIAVFVHGCFWHRHAGCKIASTPKSNTDFWISKFNRNTERDARVVDELVTRGWRVFIAWECETNTAAKAEQTARRLVPKIRKGSPG